VFGAGTVGVRGAPMFFFFSNRMGCLPSLMLSVGVTVLILLITGALR
jgi:hypothetical protein